jgi:hypothetical protein
MNHTRRGVPVPDGEHYRYRRSDESDVEQKHGKENQRQSDVVVTGPLPFDVLDLSLGPAGFKADGTEMLTLEVTITQRA